MAPIVAAAVQMAAQAAPKEERLARAERLIAAAAQEGAQLVVLPELFNIGYQYDPANYAAAEPLDGPTRRWMARVAAEYAVHLAGSLLLEEGGAIYNSLMLLAPDGRLWRYDKRYPWGWERAYFEPGAGITVADTDLGKIGLLICWDTAHRGLWRAYAGLVQCMVIASCPPDVSAPTYHLPNGATLEPEDFGPLVAQSRGAASALFGPMLNEQTAWLGVPAINTVGCGELRLGIPRGRAMLLTAAMQAPALLRYLPQARGLELTCSVVAGCKIIDAAGGVVAELPQAAGEGVITAPIELADAPPVPSGEQPPTRLPAGAYVLSDRVLPRLMAPLYQRALQGHTARLRTWALAAFVGLSVVGLGWMRQALVRRGSRFRL